MKCEHCGKNEVNFVYQSNINGHTEEHRLCSECAAKLGYTQKFAQQRQSMMNSFFGGGLFDDPMGGFLEDGFFEAPRLLGRMNRFFGENLFDDFFSDMPALGAAPEKQPEPPQQDTLVSQEEQSRFSRMRQRNALRTEMKQAIRQENFERAAELRDQLRAMDAGSSPQETAQ